MSLFGVMRTGVSGMNAQSNKLSTVSDNIANVNTTGYKRASTEFSSLILKSGEGSYDSGAVESHIRYAISDQGHLQFTTSTTDLAVQGNGFFVVSDPAGNNFLTRAGSFVPDSQGDLVNAAGFKLMGLPGAVPFYSSGSFSGLQAVNIGSLAQAPQPSTLATVSANLDPSTPIIPAPPAAPPAGTPFTSKTSVVAYDNIGRAVTLDVYAYHTGVDQWQIQAFDASTAAAGGGFPYTSAVLDSQTFRFDTTAAGKGALLPPPPPAGSTATSLNFTVPGGSPFKIDLSNMTQVASSFSFKATVDGSAPAPLEKVEIDNSGFVNAIFANGTKSTAFTIPLADVPSRDNLTPEVGNVYSLSLKSGSLQVGSAAKGGLGTINSGALEESNVDLATELTEMIESQRSFTANSKSFQTGGDLLDVVVNLKR